MINSIVSITGGLALFLYGAQESARFFRQNISGSLREGIGRLAGNRSRSFFLGALLAAVAQSSAIAISFGIGFVDAGILSLADSLLMVMGASFGGTLVSILLSFNIFDYAPILFAGAFFLGKLNNRKIRLIAGVMRCITIIFLGMMFLRMGAGSLFQDGRAREIAITWSSIPLLMGTAAFVFAVIFQSRSAIIGLGIALAASNALPAVSALPVALGAHLGSSLIAVISSFGGRLSARRMGFCSSIYYIFGSIAFVFLMPFAHRMMSDAGLNVVQELVYGQIMIALFNIIIFLPFSSLVSDLSVRLVKASGALDQPMYIEEELLSVPSVAVLLLSREMARLSNYIEAYLQMLMIPSHREKVLFEKLPAAIEALSKACQEYSYRIHVPGEDQKLQEKFASISRTMSILRSMSKTLCGEISEILSDEATHATLLERTRKETWNEWSRLSRKILRTSFRAFVIGEKGLIEQTRRLEREYNEVCRKIRDEITGSYFYGRDIPKTIRMISLMQGFLGMSKILAEDEELFKLYEEEDPCQEVLFERDD
ncbi:MAG: Na/Pi cotransporter family protein [Synergistaceae bacterium]|nr:Na/Pi cotransporter family protein [Synergistaceae bacterium]